ncbi:MAG: glycoside hydrolase family 127 protein [Anaerolineae bacterium]
MLHRDPCVSTRLADLRIPLRRQDVILDDPFWSPRYAQWRSLTINDVFIKFEKAGVLQNFERVAQGRAGGHAGPPFIDGLFYEVIRAASDFLAGWPDDALNSRLDRYISCIAAAQSAVGDGYINTTVTLTYPEQRWGANGGDQIMNHEEYNAGCLVEAGVHHYLATHKTSLLKLGVQFTDYMCSVIGPPPRKNVVPSHPLAEEAVVKLYQLLRREPQLVTVLGCRKQPEDYLQLVRFWMDNRGNHAGRTSFGEYSQDHFPLHDQPEAVGHAVRATLLYAGLAALAAEDDNLCDDQTLQRLWRDVVESKMFVSGGVGPVKEYEGFGPPYFLPTSGYIETCAGAGLAFWASRMNRLFSGAEYFDIYERVAYNVVLAGISLEGTHYSYENPLVSQGNMHRWSWHGCPCCPPMLLKLYAELPGLIMSQADDNVYVNLYVGCHTHISLPGGEFGLHLATQYPWQGLIQISIHSPVTAIFTLHLRIPGWCRSFVVRVNGRHIDAPPVEHGYAAVRYAWQNGDTVTLELAMPVERVIAHPRVSDLQDRVAVQRGPLVYCLEGVDNPQGSDPTLPPDPVFTCQYQPDVLGGITTVTALDCNGAALTFIPYYTWDNRATGDRSRDWLQVWLRQQNWAELRSAVDKQQDTWEEKLYQFLID